jgi:hypothetical protein
LPIEEAMATPWVDAVKQTGQLAIFPGPKVTHGPWKAVFGNALTRFNDLSNKLQLGVTLTQATKPPQATGGGADVQFEVANGKVTFTVLGSQFSREINGNALHGDTFQAMITGAGPDRITKAFIWIPVTPRAGGPGGRVVGDGVKLLIAVHEMIHACGLEDADHSDDSDPDVFCTFQQLLTGQHPHQDQLQAGALKMPPVYLNKRTAAKIQSLW